MPGNVQPNPKGPTRGQIADMADRLLTNRTSPRKIDFKITPTIGRVLRARKKLAKQQQRRRIRQSQPPT